MEVVDKYERSRVRIARLSKCEIEFLGPFKNGMKWNSNELLDPKKGIFHIVDKTKTSVHLVPVGGTMWDRISVPNSKMKSIKRVKA